MYSNDAISNDALNTIDALFTTASNLRKEGNVGESKYYYETLDQLLEDHGVSLSKSYYLWYKRELFK